MTKSKIPDNEMEVIEALDQLKHQNGLSGMAPRQIIGGGTASPLLNPRDDILADLNPPDDILPDLNPPDDILADDPPPECDLQELEMSLAGKKFPLRLYEVVDYAPLDKSIRWNGQGTAVVIPSRDYFVKHGLRVLSKSYPSFKRQMNVYGFRKNNASDVIEYVHKDRFFQRDRKKLLEEVCTKFMQTKRAREEGTEQPLTSPTANITSSINNVISARANVTSLVPELNALREHVTSHGEIGILPYVTFLGHMIASFKASNDTWVDSIHSAISQFPDLVANGRSSSG